MHDIDSRLTLRTFAEQHHVPVGSRVMVWFNNAHTINTDTGIFKRRAHFAPDFHQITLAVFWRKRCIIPLVIKINLALFFRSDLTCWVIFRRRGDGDKHTDMPRTGCILFYSCNGTHQLHAADFRVRNTPHDFINQVDALACFDVFQITGFQIFHCGQTARANVANGLFAGIA
ncbi:hypothetical protein SRABI106_01730 [Rahnella aquatilis]|nr:hypothetical protein SRABI106_01730 [Rahnella aquatilis]